MSIWSQVAALSVGGALGVNARYWLSVAMNRWVDSPFPWATVTINVTGSFAIGFVAVILAHHWPHHPVSRLFVVTGFLGGYTTFSSFAFESLKLWEDDRKTLATANTVGSVVAGLAAVVLGVMLARALIGKLPQTGETAPPGLASHAEDLELPSEAFLEEGRDS